VGSERIAVIGAGIVGCAVAFELARRGAEVVVFEARRVGGGATQASAGILAPYIEAHGGGPLFDLTVRGLRAYDAFVADVRNASRIPFEYRRDGTLEIAQDAARVASLRSRLRAPWAAAAGLRWLDASALRTMLPSVAADALGALQCADHGHVAVLPFLSAIVDGARHLGVRIHEGARVERVERAAGSVSVRVADTAASFDRVVVCTGAWTAALETSFERTLGERIRPVRGQLVTLAAPEVAVPSVLWTRDCYVVPWRDGTRLVGATEEDVGFDERATVEGVRGLLEAAEGVIPALSHATFLEVRTGLRPASRAGVPLLGPADDPRIVYASGHFRNGILLAPLTATIVADYILADARDPAFSTT
jgi:glycine oxidase